LGGGSFLLKPKVLEVDMLSRRIAIRLQEENIDIDNWLDTLRDERKKLVKEKYSNLKFAKK